LATYDLMLFSFRTQRAAAWRQTPADHRDGSGRDRSDAPHAYPPLRATSTPGCLLGLRVRPRHHDRPKLRNEFHNAACAKAFACKRGTHVLDRLGDRTHPETPYRAGKCHNRLMSKTVAGLKPHLCIMPIVRGQDGRPERSGSAETIGRNASLRRRLSATRGTTLSHFVGACHGNSLPGRTNGSDARQATHTRLSPMGALTA